MTQRCAWATAQLATFVRAPSGYVPSDPSEKARESAVLAAHLAAFRKSGGKVEVVATPRARNQPITSSIRRSTKA